MRTPNAERAEVPAAKVTRYPLSLESEDGRSKAMFFLSCGFTTADWEVFAEALVAHVQTHDFVRSEATQWGGQIHGGWPPAVPGGGYVNIRSVWNIKPPATHPRLVTAHPLPRPSGQER